MYNIKSLSEINKLFVAQHYGILQDDVDNANNYINLIRKSRSAYVPVVGDIVRYTNKYGEYFGHAHIDIVDKSEAYICYHASSCIYCSRSTKEGFRLSTSGGRWEYIPLDKIRYIGVEKKNFWFFGHCGACANGGITFQASVNVWECDLNEQKFSTKTHDCYYINRNKGNIENRYLYRDSINHKAWETKEDLNAWLRTYRAFVLPGHHDNQIIAWTYKEHVHHVSPKEFDKVNGINDVELINGSRMMCKRIYDDEHFIVHTYYVWYWEDPAMPDFVERSNYQNQYRRRYECAAEVYQYARNEIASGKTEAII